MKAFSTRVKSGLVTLGVLAVTALSGMAQGQIVLASDSAAAATYATDLANGANGGSGFSAWALTPNPDTGTAGFFTFTSADNGGAATIDTSSLSWGLFANSVATASAVRPLTTAMKVGDTFRIKLDNGNVAATRSVGWGLRSSGTNRVEFIFAGGGTEYQRIDNAGTNAITGFSFTNQAVDYAVTITGTNTYSATITPVSGGPFTVNGTLAASGSINELRVYNFSAGGAPADNLFANSISVTDNAPTLSTLARVTSSSNKFAQVNFTASFTEPVSGLTASNFALATTGSVAGASILAVTPNGGSAPQQTWNILVDTGSGSPGTVGLNLANSTAVVDTAAQALTNSTLTGEVYSIDRSLVRTWTGGADAGRGDFFIGTSTGSQPAADYATLETFLRDFNGTRQLRMNTGTVTVATTTVTTAAGNFLTDPGLAGGLVAGDSVFLGGSATGTVAWAGNTVTGTGTAFTNEVAIGDIIIAGGNVRTVTAVGSATSLTYSGATATVAAATVMTVQRTRTVTGTPTATTFTISSGAANITTAISLAGTRPVTTTAMVGNTNLYLLSDLTEAANLAIGKNTGGFNLRIKPFAGTTPTINLTGAIANLGWSSHFLVGTAAFGNFYSLIATNNVIIDGSNLFNGTTRDLTIVNTAAGTEGAVGIVRAVGSSTGFQVRNTNIAQFSATGGAAGVQFTGRSQDGSTNLLPNNGVVDNCFITALSQVGGTQGVGVVTSGSQNLVTAVGMTGLQVTNNLIYVGQRGVTLAINAGTTITGNTFRFTNRVAASSPSGVAIVGYNGATGFTMDINNNMMDRVEFIQAAAGGALGLVAISSGPTGSVTINIQNNFIGGYIATSGTAADGLMNAINLSTGVANPSFVINVDHNSIVLPATTVLTGVTAGRVAAIAATSAVGTYTLNVRNNNIRMGTTTATTSHGIFIAKTVNTTVSGNNLSINSPANYALIGASTFATFATYQVADGAAQNVDSYPSATFPRWASAGDNQLADLHYTGTPAGLNAAALVGGVTTDIDGDTRTVGNNLPGADIIGAAATNYNWVGGTTGRWSIASNWSPARTTARWNDILVFDGVTAAVTGVRDSHIGGLRLINNANVTLSTNGSNAMTGSGGFETGHQSRLLITNVKNSSTLPPTVANSDFLVSAGSTLTFGGSTTVFVDISGGAFGYVAGDVVFASTAANNAMRILNRTASGTLFDNGSTCAMAPTSTGGQGGFGLVSTEGINQGVQFASGSHYHQGATKAGVRNGGTGSSPFVSGAPNGLLFFSPGASYTTYDLGPAVSGRTFGSFIWRGASAVSSTGSGTFTLQNDLISRPSGSTVAAYTIGLTTGTGNAVLVNGNLLIETGAGAIIDGGVPVAANSVFAVRGNMTIQDTALWTPNTSANRVYQFDGSALQNINLAGKTYPNATFNNSTGFTLTGAGTVGGILTLTSGAVATTASNSLTLSNDASIALVRTSGTISGPFTRGINAATTSYTRDFPIATGAVFSPVSLNITAAGTGIGSLTAEAISGSVANVPASATAITRRWTLTPATIAGYAATVAFQYDDTDLGAITEGNLIAASYNGTSWTQYSTSINGSTNTATVAGVTAAQIAGAQYWTLYVPSAAAGVSTVSLPFGNVGAGSTSDLTFDVTNTGTAGLSVSALSLTGADPSAFSIVSPAVPFGLTAPPSTQQTVTVRFSPSGVATYSATLTVTNNSGTNPTVSLTGAGTCSYNVSPATTQNLPATTGSTSAVSVTTTSACTWDVTGIPSWLTLTSPGSLPATGNGSVIFTVAANTGIARSATVTIAGTTVTFNQADGCTTSAAPTTLPVVAIGGTGLSVAVTASGSGCTWTAAETPDAAWITNLTVGGTGSGNATFDVAANTGIARSTTLTVAGTTVTINQADGCSLSVAPGTISVGPNGASGVSAAVTASSGTCTWTAAETPDAAWITNLTAGGTGSGSATFDVAANAGATRSATLTVAGQSVTVTQYATTASASLDFGYVKTAGAGGSPVSLNVVVTNDSGTTINYNVTSAAPYSASATFAATPGTSNLAVQFAPTALGLATGTVTLTPNPPNAQLPNLTTNVSGNGFSVIQGISADIDGATGGTVTVGAGGTFTNSKLIVPPGAFTGTRTIVIEQAIVNAGNRTAIEITVTPSTAFTNPATLEIEFENPTDVTSGILNNMTVGRLNLGIYNIVGGGTPTLISGNRHKVTFATTTFSTYAAIPGATSIADWNLINQE